MGILLVIAARGGSKGVKNKNIRALGGKPLIAHTIGHALKWGKASKIVVSTDSKDIADTAAAFGALVPFTRPAELATDAAPKVPVIRHALIECEKLYGETYDIVVDLDVTAPVRTVRDIEACHEKFLRERPDTLFSVTVAHKNPYFNMVEEKPDGFVKLCKTLPGGVFRRQDAPAVYAINGSIYFYGRDFLLDEKNDFPVSDRSSIYVMDDAASYDIDREIDFEFLEFLCSRGRVRLD